VGIFDNGIEEILAATDVVRRRVRTVLSRFVGVLGAETMRRLLDVPAVVAAVLDDVDLLEQVLSDVGDEELPSLSKDARQGCSPHA